MFALSTISSQDVYAAADEGIIHLRPLLDPYVPGWRIQLQGPVFEVRFLQPSNYGFCGKSMKNCIPEEGSKVTLNWPLVALGVFVTVCQAAVAES